MIKTKLISEMISPHLENLGVPVAGSESAHGSVSIPSSSLTFHWLLPFFPICWLFFSFPGSELTFFVRLKKSAVPLPFYCHTLLAFSSHQNKSCILLYLDSGTNVFKEGIFFSLLHFPTIYKKKKRKEKKTKYHELI